VFIFGDVVENQVASRPLGVCKLTSESCREIQFGGYWTKSLLDWSSATAHLAEEPARTLRPGL